MQEYTIVNLVANTKIGMRLDLSKLKKELSNSEYNPEVYYALIYRSKKPKLSILVNTSGKIIFTGAKSLEEVKTVRNRFLNELEHLNYSPNREEITIQNMVIKSKVNIKPTLEKIAVKEPDSEYNPEVFPGLIVRKKQPSFSCLIFNSGNIILTGLKKIKNIKPSLEIIKKICED